jgi:acyl-CoA synthetase (AMP-forming)/AMP-acid ligase II
MRDDVFEVPYEQMSEPLRALIAYEGNGALDVERGRGKKADTTRKSCLSRCRMGQTSNEMKSCVTHRSRSSQRSRPTAMRLMRSTQRVLRHRSPMLPPQYCSRLRKRLRSTKTPQVIQFRDEMPYNETGKLLRRVLREDLSELSSRQPRD